MKINSLNEIYPIRNEVMNPKYGKEDSLPLSIISFISSIPTLMNNPFITSTYATNEYNGIGSILKNEGYSTSFFHGGKKGTMGFYQFSKNF